MSITQPRATRALSMPSYQRWIGLLWLMLLLQSCLSLSVSRYDGITYTNLTRLKAETTLLVKSFDQKPVAQNLSTIKETQLNLQIAYEYEAGKGDENSDTVKQFNKIIDLFGQDISDYQEGGPGAFGKRYFNETAKILGQAFDIVIATENTKNQ